VYDGGVAVGDASASAICDARGFIARDVVRVHSLCSCVGARRSYCGPAHQLLERLGGAFEFTDLAGAGRGQRHELPAGLDGGWPWLLHFRRLRADMGVTGVRSERLLMMADAKRREHSMRRPLAAGFS